MVPGWKKKTWEKKVLNFTGKQCVTISSKIKNESQRPFHMDCNIDLHLWAWCFHRTYTNSPMFMSTIAHPLYHLVVIPITQYSLGAGRTWARRYWVPSWGWAHSRSWTPGAVGSYETTASFLSPPGTSWTPVDERQSGCQPHIKKHIWYRTVYLERGSLAVDYKPGVIVGLEQKPAHPVALQKEGWPPSIWVNVTGNLRQY